MANETIQLLSESIRKLEKWVEDHRYKGYEPFDGLSSFLRPLTFDSLFLDRLLMQTIRQSPINLRPLFGVKPQESTKGRGYMASGHLTMFNVTADPIYKEKAVDCLEWLIKNKSPKYSEYSWGNHFDFAGRGGRYSKFEPIIVWTSLIGQGFLDAYEILHDERYLEVARSICQWILNLPREGTDSGSCISYVAYGQISVHNSNLLGAAVLARTAKYTRDSRYLTVAEDAIKYSCTRQRPDGSWYYAEQPMFHWIDNFHTGYNLDSLKCYIENTGDKTYEDNLQCGFHFYKTAFFEANGRPKYYHQRAYPIDSQCISQAIETLANFVDYDDTSLKQAVKVAKWAIDQMQDKSGYFYYRQYPLIKAKIPMLHWGQATTYKALSRLLLRLKCEQTIGGE
jgi:rhamnogalacturonyl hydrolase YesR